MSNGGLPFRNVKPLIGMIHLSGTNGEVVPRALKELEIYEHEGLDGAIVENHDCKDLQKLCEVLHRTKKSTLSIGVNILPNEFSTAFNIAERYNASFIQLEYVAGQYAEAPHGIDIREYTMSRRCASDMVVLGGVHPKYYSPLSPLLDDLKEGASRASAIVVTGSGTGKETPLEKIKTFRRHLGTHPLFIGAGLTPENAIEQLRVADGAIVGTYFKKDGQTSNPVDGKRVRDLVHVVKTMRPR